MNIAEKCDTIENENPNNRRNPLVANNVNVKKLEADLWPVRTVQWEGRKYLFSFCPIVQNFQHAKQFMRKKCRL